MAVNEEKQQHRGRHRRNWVKIDCLGILSGSINYQYTLEEQAIWIKLIAYSALCGGPPGVICDNDGKEIPNWYLASELHCPEETLESTITKGIAEGRVANNGSGLVIVNFDTYQFTEYDRQRPYRDAKKTRQDRNNPDKFTEGPYGKLVCTSADDVRKLRKHKKELAGSAEKQTD